MSPVVSVIVPVYQAERFLARCVDSILAQTLADIEVILVDDGSTDASVAICDRYASADSRVKVVHQPNRGVASARNAGLEAARGEYIIHCDADDWVEPQMYQILYERASATGADLVSCDFIREYGDRSEVDPQLPSTITPYGMILGILDVDIYGSVWNKLVRRDVILKADLRFDTRLSVYEDQCFLCLLLKHLAKIEHISQPLYHYDCHSNPDSLLGKVGEDQKISDSRRLEILISNFPDSEYPEIAYRYKRLAKLNMFVDHTRFSADQARDAYAEINQRLINEAPGFPHTEFFFKLLLCGYPRLGRALMRIKKMVRPMNAR